MALIECGECGNKVSTQAAACPQCGAPPVPPLPLAQPAPSSEFKVGCIAFGVITVFLAAGVWGLREMQAPAVYPPQPNVRMDEPPTHVDVGPPVSAEVSVSVTHLRVFNAGPADWPEYIIRLNGSSGYRYTGYRLSAGLGTEIDLISFVDRAANRFQPLSQRVQDAVISVPGMKDLSWSR